jgi:hypothetical protein
MPAVYALAPAQAVAGNLDYTKEAHAKIYKSGIRPVSETLYDCEPDGLFQFLKEVKDRSDEMGWTASILNITTTDENGAQKVEDFMKNYGTITLEDVESSERLYIGGQNRQAQNSYMLYKCLMASLTNEAKKKIMIWSDQYTIETHSAGVALLKVIVRESHLDTNATTNQIRTKLSSLDQYIATVDSDIGRFNQHVKLLIQSLNARNQTTSDLLINLFKGYGACSDEVFRAWLNRKQDDHEEGEEMTPDELMLAAKNKYDSMVEKGTWNAPSAEEKIIALEAKLNSTVKKMHGEWKNKGNAKKPAGNNKINKKKQGNGANDHPKTWPPPKGDKKEATWKDQKWYWCGKDTGGKCEKWRRHTPKECTFEKGTKTSPNAKRPSGNDEKKKESKKLKIAKAYIAKVEKQEDDDAIQTSDSD